MKNFVRIFIAILIIIIIGLIFNFIILPSGFSLKSKTTFTTVSLPINDFKQMCSDTRGEYVQGVFYGAAPVPYVYCGYDKAKDAGRLCKSENQTNSCYSCTYKASCGPAAGDFGPEHCYCGNFKNQKNLSWENIPH